MAWDDLKFTKASAAGWFRLCIALLIPAFFKKLKWFLPCDLTLMDVNCVCNMYIVAK